MTTRRAFPRWPSWSASTAETADRYAGTSGSTHGARNETNPARNATGIAVRLTRLAVEARELLVNAALELRVELRSRRARPSCDGSSAVRAAPRRRCRRRAAARGSSQARSPNPPSGGSAITPGPNSATSASLISCSEAPAAMRRRMNGFIRSATGRVRLVERRLADGADELGLEVGRVRRRRERRARNAGDAARRARAERSAITTRAPLDGGLEALAHVVTVDRHRRTPRRRGPRGRSRTSPESRSRRNGSSRCRPDRRRRAGT